MSAMGEAAQGLAARGWAVFPCFEPAGRGCTCRPGCSSPAKHPRVRHGLQAASTDAEQIAAWWRRWPQANIGLRTGLASGLGVLDIDPRHGGEASLAALVGRHGPLPSGITVATGGGGTHHYFAHPGAVVPNDAGRRLGPGLDIRGDGGYVIAPPSIHASGRRYAWTGTAQLPALPSWLVDLAVRPRAVPPPAYPHHAEPRDRRGTAWAQAALRREADAVRSAPEGTRNCRLNLAAFRLGQLVGSGGLGPSEIEATLTSAGATAGLGEREIARTIASGLASGSARRYLRRSAARELACGAEVEL